MLRGYFLEVGKVNLGVNKDLGYVTNRYFITILCLFTPKAFRKSKAACMAYGEGRERVAWIHVTRRDINNSA
ncbi:hypothetical protein L596_025171 [Steinernema carpocapsae]|uniref:Uncharacterized protein n=1 Tax=Steinernema carpocapsae TaxID=34508 RepID=A0A4U5M708_STECR|nr:hypothetical protein L596_025171 [Steinernema carpocapsae]